jgi:enamine deaminase RidA (YjgF/YER057c/UK114 family)
MRKFLIPTLCLLLATPALAASPEVIRHKPANSNFPIATAVEVPSGRTVVYVSGQVPAAIDPAAPPESATYGDTKTQTISVMNKIKAVLEGMNLKMGDVVKMQVFLAGDPAKDGKMDFAGFMEGYSMYFGTAEQPNLPARSTMQVAALVNPAYLVEIEVTAVRP